MNWRQCFNGLELEDNASIHEKIHTVAALELLPFVNYRQGFLPFEGDASQREFLAEAFFVRGLK